ncbi:MAG: ABC transporter substrate-binding protein [Acidimicrobiaceae bacterium]|nr:ABC transporter substrate-binding protein [Acidimicrobiaceae bacterium]
MKSTRRMLAVLCALALVASACGDDEPDTSTADAAAATAQAEAAAAEAEAEAAEAERAAAQAEADAAQAAAEEAQAAAEDAAARLAEAEAAAAEASAEQQAEAQAALEAAQAEADAAQAAAEAAQAEAEMAASEAAEAQEALAAAEGAIAHDIGVDTETQTIRVGLNTDLTGIFAPLTTKITDAHLAYWEWVNDNGGIQGWTIEPVVLDNAYDVPTHLENYEVMSGDGPESVVMFATSTGSPHSASTSELLIEDNMAAIPLSWYSGWADPSIGKNLFEVQTNYCIEAMNGTTYMAETYGPNVAIATFPGDYGQDAARGVKIAAEALGLNVVYDGEGAVIPGADQTPVITGIVESGADWVWVTLNPGHTAQLLGGSAAAGFTGQWIGSAPSWNPALLLVDGFKELADAFYTHSTYTVLLGEGAGAGAVGQAAGMQELLDVMREYRPEAPWDDFYIISWIQGYVVHQILDKAISNGNLTRAGVLAAANQVTADLNGLAPDQSWVGNPNDNVVRETYLYDVDLSLYTPGATISDEDGNSGYKLIKGPYASETALNWEYEPCFVAS